MTKEQHSSTDQELDALLAELPEHKPKADLWQKIEPQLVEQRHSEVGITPLNWRHWQAWAAGIAMIALTATLFWQPLTKQSSKEQLLSQHFQQQKSLLVEALGHQASDAWVGDWRYQLKVMDDAVEQIQQALRFSPEDPDLLVMLEHLYRQQIDFMQAVLPQRMS